MAPTAARFTLDLEAFIEGMVRGTAPDMRKAQLRYSAYGIVFLLLGLVERLMDGGTLGMPVAFWLGCAIAIGLLIPLRPLLYRRQLRDVLSGRADLGRRVEVRLSEADLTIDVEGVRTTAQRLATLAGVEAFEEGILVELLKREFLWIPAAAFGGLDRRDRFVRHILERAPLPDPAL